jgi:ferritin-like metal-binding protein YciE
VDFVSEKYLTLGGKGTRSGALDLSIIGATPKVEHCEISAYGTARTIAEKLGNQEVSKLLRKTEDEEKAADGS